MLRGIGIKSKKCDILKDTKDFLQLYKLEWQTKISSLCRKALDVNKFNKVQLLPFTEDLLKVRQYMKEQIPLLTKQLNSSPTLELWRKLAEIAGSHLTVFNRHRGNEVFNLLVSRFMQREKFKEAEMEEIRKSLTPLERRLMNRQVHQNNFKIYQSVYHC